MNNNLENYINKNRRLMDSDLPNDEKIWKEIAKGLGKDKPNPFRQFLKIAAVVLVVIAIAFLFGRELSENGNYSGALAKCSKEAWEKEKKYRNAIKQKKLVAFEKANDIGNNEILIFLKDELKDLDDVQQEAMADLELSGCKKESMKIIYDTYEKRIAILDKIILETRKINAYENK